MPACRARRWRIRRRRPWRPAAGRPTRTWTRTEPRLSPRRARARFQIVKLAFGVVTYFAKRYVVPLLDTLRANTDLTGTVVIVVENASTDGTRALLQTQQETWTARTGGQLRVLPQDRNTGFAEGCNIGIAEAKRVGVPYAMLLNQDLELAPGWLPPLLAVMQARPEVAAAQPVFVLHDEPDRLNTAGNAIHFCGFGFCDRYRAPVAEVLPDPHEGRSVPYASGAALLLRLAAQGGWLGIKLKTYGEIARALPGVLADRKVVQARRSPDASDGDYLT